MLRIRPVVSASLGTFPRLAVRVKQKANSVAGQCLVISVFGAIILAGMLCRLSKDGEGGGMRLRKGTGTDIVTAFGSFYARKSEGLHIEPGTDASHISKICYTAPFVYACLVAFCGLQVSVLRGRRRRSYRGVVLCSISEMCRVYHNISVRARHVTLA